VWRIPAAGASAFLQRTSTSSAITVFSAFWNAANALAASAAPAGNSAGNASVRTTI
jgi:hypothetical protein